MTDAERIAAIAYLKKTTQGYLKTDGTARVKLGVNWTAAMKLLEAPAPPPVAGTRISALTDMQGVFNLYKPLPGEWGQYPNITAPPYVPWGHGAGVKSVNGGFHFDVRPEMVSPWDDTTKVCMMYGRTSPLGATEDWLVDFEFPSAGNPDGFAKAWHNGEFFQWHTSINSGNNININGDGTFRFMVHNEAGAQANPGNPQLPWFHIIKGPLIKFDHVYKLRIRLKWSSGADGFYQLWLDGVKWVDLQGATLHPSDHGYLQFGFYSVRQLRNAINFHSISYSEE